MSEWNPAHIYIGGDLDDVDVAGLLEVIQQEDCGFGWSSEDDECKTAADLLKNLDGPGWLHLSSYQAVGGMFELLEKFLRDRGLPYNRFSDAGSDWDACVNSYRKGFKEDIDLVTNNAGDPVIRASVAIRAFAALRIGNVHAALEDLRPYREYVVPPLPPFRIINGVP